MSADNPMIMFENTLSVDSTVNRGNIGQLETVWTA